MSRGHMFEQNRVLRQILEFIGFSGYRAQKEFEKDFDPSRFNDRIAVQTEWTALPASGSNIQTTKLVQKSSNQSQFEPNILGKMIYLVFIVLGAGLLVAVNVFQFLPELSPFNGAIDTTGYIVACLGGIVICLIGILVYSYNDSIVFDRSQGFTRKAAKMGFLFNRGSDQDQSVALRDIYALQIIPVYHSGSGGKNRPFYNFQLNLVLTNAQRVPVVNYHSLEGLREDGVAISQLIERPLWDGTRK